MTPMDEQHLPDGLSDSERAYRLLRSQIVEGKLEPGERMVEMRIAETLGVSRTPVREAVRRLETEGLVVSERNRGAHVRTVEATEIGDLYQARSRIEGLMAELAARRRQSEDLTELKCATADFDRAVAAGNETIDRIRALQTANATFHAAIVTAARAPQVFRVLAAAVDTPLVFASFRRYSNEELQRSSIFHHLIADAIVAQAPDRAGRLMIEHVLQGRDTHVPTTIESGGEADA